MHALLHLPLLLRIPLVIHDARVEVAVANMTKSARKQAEAVEIRLCPLCRLRVSIKAHSEHRIAAAAGHTYKFREFGKRDRDVGRPDLAAAVLAEREQAPEDLLARRPQLVLVRLACCKLEIARVVLARDALDEADVLADSCFCAGESCRGLSGCRVSGVWGVAYLKNMVGDSFHRRAEVAVSFTIFIETSSMSSMAAMGMPARMICEAAAAASRMVGNLGRVSLVRGFGSAGEDGGSRHDGDAGVLGYNGELESDLSDDAERAFGSNKEVC